MGWKDIKSGSGQYIVLKNDKDTVELVFIGEPHEQLSTSRDGKAKRRYLFNVATPETEGKAAIFACGPQLATQIAQVLSRNPEDQDGELAGKVAVILTRHGAAGSNATTYELGKPKKLTPARVKAVAALELVDLAAEKAPANSKF